MIEPSPVTGLIEVAIVEDNAALGKSLRMVVESEQSIDWGEAQLDLIKMTGLENYLAQQFGETEKG